MPPKKIGRTSTSGHVLDAETGCWNWTGTLIAKGYGVAWNGVRKVVAHRLCYERAKGPIPSGMQLDHLCRNRRCVNPDHLEPVTNAENCHRGSMPRLSKSDVVEIRRLHAAGLGCRRLVRQFAVSMTTILNILNRRTWKGIEPDGSGWSGSLSRLPAGSRPGDRAQKAVSHAS